MDSLRRLAAIICVGGVLIAAALYSWQRDRVPSYSSFSSLKQFRAAYARVTPGTPGVRLPRLGFDHTLPGAQTLSYLGTMEFLMPKSSRDYDRLDPAILACLAVRDRCGTYVFWLGRSASRGSTMFNFLAHAVPDGAHAVFLMKRGRVTYKEMVGE
ncbi:MAG TPA: hypothetical protein VHV26_14505 [Rhizomicrobium sp.]|jgi:hypothetical protein|nr:hypothetical protein [Rhizomicrobium sp.]